jgi:hypothetical protein
MAVEEDATDTPAFEPDLYVDDMTWPPPHWDLAAAPGASPDVLPAVPVANPMPQGAAPIPPGDSRVAGIIHGGAPIADAYMHGPRGATPVADDRTAGIIHGGGPELALGQGAPAIPAFHPALALASPPMQPDAISGGVMPDQAQAPSPELAPDAISGGVAPDQQQDVRRAGELGTDVETASLERNLENMSPEDAERVRAAREAERTRMLQAQSLQALKDRNDAEAAAAAQHARILTELRAREQNDAAEAQKLAQTKIETQPGIGRAIAGMLVGFVGGLAAPYTGGRNLGIEGFQQGLNMWIDAQKTELANKRDLLGKRMATTSDALTREDADYRQGEILRQAAYQRAIDLSTAEAQNYDPRGTTAQKIADGVNQLKAQQAAAWQAYQQKNFDNKLKVEEASLKEQTLLETSRHNRVGEGLDSYKAGLEGQRLNLEAKRLDKETNREEKERLDKEATLNRQLGVSATVDDSGTPKLLVNKDGTPWRARDDKTAGEIAKSVAAAEDYNRITNAMIRGIAEHGGESDYLKSADWQRMKSMQQAAVAELHEAYNIQGFRETTAEFFEKMASAGVDPTSFVRDASSALAQSNHDLQGKINARLRAEQYTGAPIRFADTSQFAPTESLVQGKTSVQSAEAAAPGAFGEAERKLLNPTGYSPGGFFDIESRAENSASGPTGLALPDDRRVMQAIAVASGSKIEDERASAFDRLVDAANAPDDSIANGVIGRVRGESPELYKRLLEKLPEDRRKYLEAIDRAAQDASLGAQTP